MTRRIYPSNADTWLYCPGSPAMEETYGRPDEDRTAADAGTLAHACAAIALKTQNQEDPPEFGKLDVELQRAVRYYVNTYVGISGISVELKRPVLAVSHELNVRIDLSYVDRGVLNVVDFKTGRWPVGAEQNMQLLCGVSALACRQGMDKVGKFRAVIEQPTSFLDHYRDEWEFDRSILGHYESQLRNSYIEAQRPEPAIVTGKQCSWCKARHICPAMRDARANAIQVAKNYQPGLQLSPESLALELDLLTAAEELIKYRKKAIEAEAEMTINSGGVIPGYGMIPGRKTREWSKPTSEIYALGEMHGIDLRDVKPYSPAQAEKAGVPRKIIDNVTESREGALRLGRLKFEATKIFSNNPLLEANK